MRGYKVVIFAVGLGFFTSIQAQFLNLFVPVPNTWNMIANTQLGATTRILALDQNPYPFCFSYAASALFDQQRCMYNNKNCSKEPRTSALAATSAGQELFGLIDITKGGIGSYSVKHLIETGFVFDASCNYNIHDPKLPEYQTLLAQQINAPTILTYAQTNWLKYKDYTPYLEYFYRKQFTNTVKSIQPKITEEKILVLLNQLQDSKQLVSDLLLQPSCFSPIYRDNTWQIHTKTILGAPKPEQVFNIINQQLTQNRPIFTGICTGPDGFKEGKCLNSLHAVIVIATAKFKSQYTNDIRTAYWIVNTWGETWQTQNSDGWIFAESFVERVTGEIIWLSKK